MRRFSQVLLLVVAVAGGGRAPAEPVSFAGPAMGTTYRVSLAAPVAGLAAGEVHREVDRLLARIDRAASGWREGSDVGRFHRAAAGAWVEIDAELGALLAVARRVHADSAGAFDVTAAPLVRCWRRDPPPAAAEIAAILPRVGMGLIEERPAAAGRPAAIRKTIAGVEIDLDGIGPGYAVDRIGERLVELGSANHLVELGGEVRAWGTRDGGAAWRVRLRAAAGTSRVIELASGRAIATASSGPGRAVVDPRTGCRVAGPARSLTVIAASCAEADAWAVAAVVLALAPDADGVVSVPPAPSTTAVPPAAR
ncbi:MAG: FAD:protein FMN transferase [Planctomycetaceae bacterium]